MRALEARGAAHQSRDFAPRPRRPVTNANPNTIVANATHNGPTRGCENAGKLRAYERGRVAMYETAAACLVLPALSRARPPTSISLAETGVEYVNFHVMCSVPTGLWPAPQHTV
ncbi:unnamed protein product, partial [Iphiclides podalirius]